MIVVWLLVCHCHVDSFALAGNASRILVRGGIVWKQISVWLKSPLFENFPVKKKWILCLFATEYWINFEYSLFIGAVNYRITPKWLGLVRLWFTNIHTLKSGLLMDLPFLSIDSTLIQFSYLHDAFTLIDL